MSDKLSTIDPHVTSLAKPASNHLLTARFEVQRNPRVKAIFEQYRGAPDAAQKIAEEIAGSLGEVIEGSPEEVAEVCRYLADEYVQIGDSLLVISTETGRAIAKLSEGDLWQPPAAARESGAIKARPTQLRPELAGLMMQWTFDRSREGKIATELAKTLHQTPALAEHGDRRLRTVTRSGRQHFVEELRGELPTLLDGTRGLAKGFLGLFRTSGEPDPSWTRYASLKAVARITTGLQDHKAKNLRFDDYASVKANIAIQWACDVARTVSQLTHTFDRETIAFPRYVHDELRNGVFWVAGEREQAALTIAAPLFHVLPVYGARPIVFKRAEVGLFVPQEFDLAHREIHDRWEIGASMTYDLWLDSSCVQALNFTDLPAEEYLVEVV